MRRRRSESRIHRLLPQWHSCPDSEDVKTPLVSSGLAPSDPARSSHRQSVLTSLGTILLVLTGCTSTPVPVATNGTGTTSNGPALTWSKVELPRDTEPVTLAADGTELLVGGFAATGQVRPRLLQIAPDGASSVVRLFPHSPYAFQARWRSIATDGRRIFAVGGAAGGAHSNTRWTIWAGTNDGVAEIPQKFDTFGGWGAGDVIGPVLTSAGAAIVGSWEGANAGLDAAIWLAEGHMWVRQPSAGSALESTRELLVGLRSATSAGSGIVLPGSVVHLTGGKVRQSAALWRSERLNAGWARVDLPESGASGEAISAQCPGQNCVLAGEVDGALALWQLSASAVTRIPAFPHVPLNPGSPLPAPLVAGGRIIAVASAARDVVVLTGNDQSWVLSQGPVGRAVSSAIVGGWLYVIAAQAVGSARLWRCPVKDLS